MDAEWVVGALALLALLVGIGWWRVRSRLGWRPDPAADARPSGSHLEVSQPPPIDSDGADAPSPPTSASVALMPPAEPAAPAADTPPPPAWAKEAAGTALREAQESARRELAARVEAAREARAAQARADAERAQRQRQLDDQRAAEAARQAAEAEAARRQAEADALRRAAEEETARLAAAAEAARRAEEAEAARRAAEAEAARRAAEADAARRAAEADAARRAAEADAARLLAEAQAARLAQEAEAARVAAEAESARRAAATPPPVAAPRQPADTLVMVADDSKVVRVKTSRLLAAHHFRVVLAEDGERAWSLLIQEPPQVLITDVEMPGMDGLALTRTLRADVRTASIPVVMITSADDRLRDEAADAGVTVLMGKPYTDHDLVQHVARLAGVALPA